MLATAKRSQSIFCSQKGRFNVGGGMSIGKKGGLELRGWEINSPLQHSPEERCVAVCVRGPSCLVVDDRLLSEEGGTHRADPLTLKRDALLCRQLLQPGLQQLPFGLKLLVESRLVEKAKGLDAGPHGEGIAGKGPGLIDGPQGGDLLHDAARTTVRAHRQAPADDLAEAEIGRASCRERV